MFTMWSTVLKHKIVSPKRAQDSVDEQRTQGHQEMLSNGGGGSRWALRTCSRYLHAK